MSPPVLIGGLTVLAIVAILVVANLPRQNSELVPQEIGFTGHDVAPTTQGPDIHFAVQAVDFGLVPLGKEVSYAFSYANVGNQTLRIEDVQVRVVEGC